MNPENSKQSVSTSGSNERKRKAEDEPREIERPEVNSNEIDHNDDDDETANDDNYVTMVDVLEEEQKLEEEAFALLGGSDDKNCTYLHGYVGRQAIYACKTCRRNDADSSNQDDLAGVCLACSYACHEGHELFELYTKRNFKCDCGNSKMAGKKVCSLYPKKSDVNEFNKYNHNFIGRYCLCDRPYPDPEGDIGTMIQCVVCEDWFHDRCLNSKFPSNDDFGELICGPCMTKHSFLWNYQTQEMKLEKESTSDNTFTFKSSQSKETMQSNNEQSTLSSNEVNVIDIDAKADAKAKEEEKTKSVVSVQSNEVGTDSGIESSCDSIMLDQCKLKLLQPHCQPSKRTAGATFWEEGWRKRLCRCSECMSMYRIEEIDFLSDETDTVHHYEAKGKEKGAQISHYERGLNEINKMDRVQSIEAITEYNAMTLHFKEFLKKFAENKQVVRQKDIEQFFEELNSRKRQRLENSYPF